jgi:hypothetical protein
MLDDYPWTRVFLLACWQIIVVWMFVDKPGGGGFLFMIFSWAGFIVCFKKELAQGHW